MELEQVLARLADGARQILQADAIAVRLLNEGGAHLTVAAVSGLPPAFRRQEPIPVEHSPLDGETLAGQPLVIADARADPRAVDVPEGYRSVLCVSLIYEGHPLGTLHVYGTAPRRFSEEDAALLMPLADLGATAVAATRALMELEALEASKAHFIRVVTHELRSPVTVTQSLVRGVLKGYAGKLTDKQAEVFGRVSRRLDSLESLVNDLLALAAGRAPELAEEEGTVLLNASVGRAVLLLQRRAEERGLQMTLQPCRDELVVWGTEEGLDRIFVNLVSNAVKYTPSGGAVTVSVRGVEEQAQVEVADTGIGIPEEALPHLFQEFYRAPNAKALDEVGTGLGLAIVKDLVERYGGHIEVES
ncbi:MAG: GAF domain-containing sensor histidine kinase, partial [Chloroflexi bacterium]|nr:GAF domain-containing sensor histidine kinase [Chloroflexota bacterium]